MYRLLLFIFLFFPILVSSQNNYKVKYKMTTLFDGLKNYEAKLTFSDSQSYFEYKLALKDTATIESQDENGNYKILVPDKNTQKIYLDFKNKKSSEKKYLKTVFIVQDSLTFPDWFIFDEAKTINNHLCRKATTTYKGRDYEVWFTDEYPTMFGPWKLNGLPGLIIVAQDKRSEVFFEATEIQKIDENICKEDSSIKHVSKVEFDDQIKKWQKNYEERLKSMGDRNSKVSVKFGKAVGIEILD
jgi:GLPGLI family protein